MPIDFWEGWLTEDQYKNQLNGDDDMARASTIAEYEKLRDEAFELARAKGWGRRYSARPIHRWNSNW
jgi:hypothetical protein